MKNVEYFPDSAGLAFENVYITTADNIKINGWFIPRKDARYTLLFFHGNAGNIGHRLEKIKLLYDAGVNPVRELRSLTVNADGGIEPPSASLFSPPTSSVAFSNGVNIFIIDYRGYGQSQGKPSEKGLYLDAKSAYDYLVNNRHIQPQDIILYGESIGGAVAINLASSAKVRALIAEETFTNISDMAKKIYPIIPSFFISAKFDSLAKIKNIDAPKLFIYSKNDEIVPLELTRKLYDAAKDPKQFVELSGGHNSAFLDSRDMYVSAVNVFIKKLK
ncbi:MAG: alpha/beta hydrolase [Candidatus Omnitrophota bacterium]|nr:alpha/beta hydrolase [Candidatus Omnitrophota bacterium]